MDAYLMPWLESMSHWFDMLLSGNSVASIVLVLGVVAASGIALGSIKIKGISLGIAGVLFTGIAFSHFFWRDDVVEQKPAVPSPTAITFAAAAPSTNAPANAPSQTPPSPSASSSQLSRHHDRKSVLDFLREFGLILFVYSIGMQVGPGFFSSLRSGGVRLNILATGVVGLGFCCAWFAVSVCRIPGAAAVGLLSGAVTNTPGLAAAQQALKDVPGLDAATLAMPGIGYAVAYPFGVIGIILAIILVRFAYRRDPVSSIKRSISVSSEHKHGPGNMNLLVVNQQVIGKTIGEVLSTISGRVVVSRLARADKILVATNDIALSFGDLIHAVGSHADLDRLRHIVGEVSAIDLRKTSKDLEMKRLLVSHTGAVGKTLEELHFHYDHGVTITRINRAGMDFIATPDIELHYGDTLVAVGDTAGLAAVEKAVGNSVKRLEHPQLIPMFIGIAVGVVIGQIPISIGLPAPIKLGLAGGPLIAALIFAWLGRIGRINFFIPPSANLMIRELGIVLFLSCVGLISGEKFIETLTKGDGLWWLMIAAGITITPLLIMAVCARLCWKLDFMPLCGVLAGSMTDPPALAFATSLAGNERPALAYATVYPLTMILRILSAQLFVILFVSG